MAEQTAKASHYMSHPDHTSDEIDQGHRKLTITQGMADSLNPKPLAAFDPLDDSGDPSWKKDLKLAKRMQNAGTSDE